MPELRVHYLKKNETITVFTKISCYEDFNIDLQNRVIKLIKLIINKISKITEIKYKSVIGIWPKHIGKYLSFL